MSRMKINTQEDKLKEIQNKLKELQDLYIVAKGKEKLIKADVDKYGDEIKQIMTANNLTSSGRLLLSTTQKEDFNELRAIEILRENLSEEQFNQVVKTKEYIDDDALEKLAYNSSFDMSILAPCKTLGKITYTLRIGKEK